MLLITHDIELALSVADRVAVFRDGTVVEETSVENFPAPELLEHPFSRALWHALPSHGFKAEPVAKSAVPASPDPAGTEGTARPGIVDGPASASVVADASAQGAALDSGRGRAC